MKNLGAGRVNWVSISKKYGDARYRRSHLESLLAFIKHVYRLSHYM